jgi:hypothetical protein
MSRIEIIKDAKKFLYTIEELYEKICIQREQCISEYKKAGFAPPERISFEEIDLSEFTNDMLSIHKTLVWSIFNCRLSDSQAKKARFIAIGGICELIKSEYVGKFWKLYEKTLFDEKTNYIYNAIWAKGFREIGISLIRGERREFVQTLVLESGVPKTRAGDIIRFFEIYWRYLRSKQVSEVIIALKDGSPLYSIPISDRNILKSLSETASEYSHAFSLAISRLSTIFEYISESDEIYSGNIDEYAEKIYRVTKINPLTILRDKDQLRRLYNKILGHVTPEKLKRIIEGKPPGTMVALPDGSLTRTDQYESIAYGTHTIDGAVFSCVPASNMDIQALFSSEFDKIIHIGNSIVLKSNSSITPYLNEIERKDFVRDFISKRKPISSVFFLKEIQTAHIRLVTSNNKVDMTISGKDGFVCNPYFHYKTDHKKGIHNLYLKTNSIHLISSVDKNKAVRFVCDKGTDEICLYRGNVDPSGFISCGERSVLLDHPAPGSISMAALMDLTDEFVTTQNKECLKVASLQEVMLFSPYSHYQIRPHGSGSKNTFGNRRFALFTHNKIKPSQIQFTNIEVEGQSASGSYDVWSLKWRDHLDSCQIKIHDTNANVINWSFEKCIHYNLYVNKKNYSSPEHVVFKNDQGNIPSDFEIVLTPVPERSIQQDLFFNVIVNDSVPKKVRLKNLIKYSKEQKLTLKGTILEELLYPLWKNDYSSLAKIEIALCTLDSTLINKAFFIFPKLKVALPDGIKNNDIFSVIIDLGAKQRERSLVLKNARGRSKIKTRFKYENSIWKIYEKKYHGELELPSIGTSIEIEAVPPLRAVRFGNRETGKDEPAREILKRELGPYDLLIAGDKHSQPEIFVRGHKYSVPLKCMGQNLWSMSLSKLRGIKKRENQVLVKTKGLLKEFIIKYRIALMKIEFHKYLSGNMVRGLCSYRGPMGSCIELLLSSIDSEGNHVDIANKSLKPEGNEITEHAISIDIGKRLTKVAKSYEMSLILWDDKQKTEGHEYGKTWEILHEDAITAKDYRYVKVQINEGIEQNKPFYAKNNIELAKKILPPDDQDWLNKTEEVVNHMIVRKSLNDVATQVARVLKKEFLFYS